MTITPDQAQTLLDGVTPGPWTAEEYDDYPGDRGVPIIGGGEPGTMEAHLTAYALTLNDPDQCERDGALIAAAPDLARTVIDQAEEIEKLRSTVAAFINKRPEYITALNASRDTDADYMRWQGHAGARRQLAQELGWTVPRNRGETTSQEADQ
ncbi:hypothetical protein [Corynebacterium sp.]|uniref:hypothetical protein n=1 Tax=Corynebacterium sp. TaxID=1720 RepID=UPI003B3B305E